MPAWLLRCYIGRLSALEAERDLAALQVAHAAVNRPLPDKSYRQYTAGLRKRIDPQTPRRGGGLKALAGFGVPVTFLGEKKES